MESFTEFVGRVLKRSDKRKSKGNHPTIYECYNWVRDNVLKPAGVKGVYREEFYRIIKAVNLIVRDAYLDGEEFSFPYGVLELKAQVKKGGRYISWIKTLKAWYEDPTLQEDKIHIRNDKRDRSAILFGKIGNQIHYHAKYSFMPNREFKIAVNKKYNEGNLKII